MKLSTKQISQVAALSAISVFLGFSRLGFIPFFLGVSLTIMHVPVIIGAILTGPLGGTVIGLIFGVSSMIQANVAPNGPGDVPFTDPLVSVLPRLFIGVAAWAIYKLFASISKKELKIVLLVIVSIVVDVLMLVKLSEQWNQLAVEWSGIVLLSISVGFQLWVLVTAFREEADVVSYQLAAIAGTFTNTLLVLTMLAIRADLDTSLLWPLGSLYGSIEAVVAAMLTTGVLSIWLQTGIEKKADLVNLGGEHESIGADQASA